MHKVAPFCLIVLPAGKHGLESSVEIRTARGRRISQLSYGSRDGEHGKSVVQAAWTSDSQFFVWSMENSGGHSPWNAPTYFFSRRSQTSRSLDASVGGITTATFALKAPDTIETRRLRGDDLKGAPVRVSLSKLGR